MAAAPPAAAGLVWLAAPDVMVVVLGLLDTAAGAGAAGSAGTAGACCGAAAGAGCGALSL